MTNSNALKLMSFNCNGIGGDEKRREVFNWLHHKRYSVFLLQETHSCDRVEQQWRMEWGGKIYFAHGTTNERGVAILFKNDINVEVHTEISDVNGRFLILDVSLNDVRYTIVGVYGPNNDSPEFWANVIQEIEQFDNVNIIQAGDFNVALNPLLDREGKNLNNAYMQDSRAFLNNWLEEADLVDIWRHQFPTTRKYTWQRRRLKQFSRIDYFLVSFNLVNKTVKTDIIPGYRSDHSAIILNLDTDEQPRGPGFWRLNCSFLKDKTFVDTINHTIDEAVVNNPDTEETLLWDTIKLKVRGDSIKYSSNKKKARKNLQNVLEKRLLDLENRYQSTKEDEILEEIESIKGELHKFVRERTQGAMIRSKATWYQEGEKPTKYFLGLEKRNFANKTISRLELADGTIVSQKDRILKEEKSFYESLLSTCNPPEQSNIYTEFMTSPHEVLKDVDKRSCEGELSEKEIADALKATANNKSPGNDGLPAEFYKVFWLKIKKYLLAALKKSFEQGKLSISQRQGLITLIPKKGKDTLKLKNWRPLTLLNQDYKLASKAIASRIKAQLNYLINSDQTGFVPGRYIGENINRVLSIIEHCEQEEIPAIIMSVDYEKAFDRLEWSFIDRALNYFNFGPSLRKWVKIFYTDISSQCTNNGWSTELFKVTRGVRQGCPLSPYLFILAAEILAIHIRHDPNIEGIKINDQTESKISQYADDTALSLSYSANTIANVKQTFDKFEIVSGLKVNYDKTEILRIGPIQGLHCVLCPDINMKWTNGPIPLLGIDICPNLEQLLEINYSNVIKKIRSSADLWKRRKLTLYGKVVIIKTFLLSQIIYKASVLPNPPTKIIDEIVKVIMTFLWDDKQPRIKKEVLYNSYENGGLKLPHLPTQIDAIKIAWVKRIMMAENNCVWKLFAQNCLKLDIKLLFEVNISFKDLEKVIPGKLNLFWKDVLKSWCEYNHCNPMDKFAIQNQVIWYNSYIKINSRTCFYKQWNVKGVYKIKDLLKQDNSFLSFAEFKNKYDVNCDFLTYYGLLEAIPKVWKTILKNNEPVRVTDSNVLKLCKAKKASKITYIELIKNVSEFPSTPTNKWEEKLNIRFPIPKWQKLFQTIYVTTRSAKLRYFQFQILHCTLVTNRKLKLWKIKESEMCSFCELEVESISHLLFDCLHIKIFWFRLKSWLIKKTNNRIDFNISKIDFILGKSDSDNRLVNLASLLAKQYIYSCRCLNKFPKLIEYINRLKTLKDSELYTARYGDRYNELKEFWGWLED